jgi:ureidoacrylate peracid hydrolase
MANPHATDVIRNTNTITAALRAAGGTVIFTKHWTGVPDGVCRPRMSPMTGSTTFELQRSLLQPGTRSFELHPDLDVQPPDVVISKRRPSAFHPYAEASLEPILTERSIDTLVIAGLLTSGCCITTAVDAYQYDFTVLIASDATAAKTDEEHSAALLLLATSFATIMDTVATVAAIEDALFYI